MSIDADPQLLASAVMNLVHNAFKNTPSGGHVVLRARAEEGRLLIETEDECGGIPQSKGDLFKAFGNRRGSDRSGLGLGLLDCSEGGTGARRRSATSPAKAASSSSKCRSRRKSLFRKRWYSPSTTASGHDGLHVALVIPAEGAILERVLATGHSISPEGLSRQAYAKFDAAQMKTAWGRRHQRRFALVDGADVLASATQYDLAAVLDQQPVRVCGIASLFSDPAHRDGGHAPELVDQLLHQAARDGAAMALLFSDMSREYKPAGFEVLSMTEAELRVTESSRRGAPMTLIRGGEERDLAAIVAMGQIRATPFRFHLDRDVDFVQYALTKKRLLAGLGTASARQLHFFIAEEGIRPLPMSSSASSEARGRLRSAATVIPLVPESAPFYKRSSHVNPSSAARRSAPGSLGALYLRRSRLCRRSPPQKCC